MKKMIDDIENEGTPICENCGSAKVREGDEWYCPHCDAEIDFLGEENDD